MISDNVNAITLESFLSHAIKQNNTFFVHNNPRGFEFSVNSQLHFEEANNSINCYIAIMKSSNYKNFVEIECWASHLNLLSKLH